MTTRPGCRLLYLVGQLGSGGLERQLCYLLQAMDRKCYRPEVAVWNFSESDTHVGDLLELGVPLHPCGDRGSRSRKLVRLQRLVARLRPEVVHSYTFYTNFAAWSAVQGTAAVAVGSIRNNFEYERRETGCVLGRLSGRWPAFQICNSEAARDVVGRIASPFKPLWVRVVRNGLDLRRFPYDPQLPPVPTFLAVGRLCPEKRWDRLLRTAAGLAKGGAQFRVRHIGDGPLAHALRIEARRLGVHHLVEFLGPRTDVGSLLSRSTALIHTADDEGCPNVVMEAMACGRAVLATDAGDVPRLVEDRVTGFVVTRGDDGALAERAAALLTSPALCQRLGAAARSRAERDFGLGQLVSQTLDAYRAAGWQES